MRVRVLVSSLLLSALPLTGLHAAGLDWYRAVPRAELIEHTSAEDVERQYPLSAPRRISGRLRIDSVAEAVGSLSRATWELPEGHDAREAFAEARSQLLQQGATLLYWCEGRECGPSSLWVTRVFDAPRLVAPDDQQASLLVRLAAPADSLVALYAVTRGNRRSYLHAEQLDSRSALPELYPEPDTQLRQLRDAGSLLLPGALQAADPRLEQVVRLLQRDTSMRVLLISSEARRWRDELVARGVRERRMDVELREVPQDGLQLEWLR